MVLPSLLAALVLPAHAEDPTLDELLRNTDDVTRGASSIATMEMHVRTARYERNMRMKVWAQGEERTLIRIEAPAKDAGISTLKVDDSIWNYLPKVDRTMKVPAGMMSGNWMGSHFSNDDLVKESRLSEDFDGAITGRPGDDPDGVYTVELTPKADAAIVWGRIELTIRADRLPLEIRYLDEDMELVRTMSFSDYQELDGRQVPTQMTLVPADEPDEFTRMTYVELDFDVDIPESTFTLQALKN